MARSRATKKRRSDGRRIVRRDIRCSSHSALRRPATNGGLCERAALSAAGAAWAAVTLVGLWGGSRLSAHIAGGLVALLPNSLGLSSLLQTDAIFGHCMLLWFCLLSLSDRSSRPAAVAGSILVLAFLQTLRPQLLNFVARTGDARGSTAWRTITTHGVSPA